MNGKLNGVQVYVRQNHIFAVMSTIVPTALQFLPRETAQLKMTVFWDVVLSSLVEIYQHFRHTASIIILLAIMRS